MLLLSISYLILSVDKCKDLFDVNAYFVFIDWLTYNSTDPGLVLVSLYYQGQREMKKFIVFLSSVALVGSVSYAMDEEAAEGEMMDEAVAMEASAPSVKVSGSAALGIKSVDDGNDATEDFSLINEYKVSFSSNGTTDGGLVFGAGISIEDTHDKDPEKSVNSSHVFIGSSDGSWKLQIGGNDPGIDLVGGIGIAGDHLQGDGYKFKDRSDIKDVPNLNWSSEYDEDATIGLSGSFGAAAFRITMSDPSNSVPPRMKKEYTKVLEREIVYTEDGYIEDGKATPSLSSSAPANINPIIVGDGFFDSDGKLKTSFGTSFDAISAVNHSGNSPIDITGNVLPMEPSIEWDTTGNCGVGRVDYYTTTAAVTVDGVSLDPGVYSAEKFNDLTDAQKRTALGLDANAGIPEATKNYYTVGKKDGDKIIQDNICRTNAQDPHETAYMAGDTYIDAVLGWTAGNTNEYYVAKQMNNQWSAGFTYALDTINIGVGMDSGKGLALSLGSKLSGVDVSAYYSKSEIGDLLIGYSFPEPTTLSEVLGTRESNGLGVKASMSAGEGAKFSVAYSKVDMEDKADKREYKSFDSNSEKKKIEIDFTYDLGGGASLQAGIDKEDTKADGKSSDKTTLEAKIAMTF